MFAAYFEQRPDALVDLLVRREQVSEVTQLVPPLFVVAHSGLHQQPRNAVLHLDHLLQHKVPVAQRSAPVPDLGRSHVALRQEVAAQAVGDLAGIDPNHSSSWPQR